MITVLVIHQKLEGVTSLSGCAQTWLSGKCKKAFWKARPDFWVAGLWLLDVRVVSLCPYLLNFAPSLWLDHEVGGGPKLTWDVSSTRTGLTGVSVGEKQGDSPVFPSCLLSPGQQLTKPLLRHFG